MTDKTITTPQVNQPKGSGSLEFDGLLAAFHAIVWATAEDDDPDLAYDEAGNVEAKKLQAMYLALQSELTKARELLNRNATCFEGIRKALAAFHENNRDAWCGYLDDSLGGCLHQLKEIAALLSNQSAPADKERFANGTFVGSATLVGSAGNPIWGWKFVESGTPGTPGRWEECPIKFAQADKSTPEIQSYQDYVPVLILQDGEQFYSEALYCRDGTYRYGYDEEALSDVEKWMPIPSRDQPAPADKGQGETVAKHEKHCTLLDPEEPSAECTCNHRFMSLADDPRRCADCDAIEVISEQPAPVAVVMPERSNERDHAGDFTYEAKAWNACLDEVARLNSDKRP